MWLWWYVLNSFSIFSINYLKTNECSSSMCDSRMPTELIHKNRSEPNMPNRLHACWSFSISLVSINDECETGIISSFVTIHYCLSTQHNAATHYVFFIVFSFSSLYRNSFVVDVFFNIYQNSSTQAGFVSSMIQRQISWLINLVSWHSKPSQHIMLAMHIFFPLFLGKN